MPADGPRATPRPTAGHLDGCQGGGPGVRRNGRNPLGPATRQPAAAAQPVPVAARTVTPGRRQLLLGGGAALATAWLPGCLTAAADKAQMPPAAAARLALTAPRVAPHRIIREVAGPRPFRPQGFRVETERLDGDRLLIHHYGHGGCGVTLSWGTAALVRDIARQQSSRSALVIGCGAVGLATARLLQDAGFAVRIMAAELPPDTLSNLAGALFAPSYLVDPEYRRPAFGAGLATALRFAHRRFQLLPDRRYGVRWLPLYMLSPRPDMPLGWTWSQAPELFRSHPHAPGSHPFGDRYAHEFTMMMIEPSIYLPMMLRAFREAGGSLTVRRLHTRAELARLPARLIVNCSGMGAAELAADGDLLPIKGQLTVLAPQPAVDYAVIEHGSGLYLFPRRDGLQLGGSAIRGDASTWPDAAVSARILKGHQRLFDFRDAAAARG